MLPLLPAAQIELKMELIRVLGTISRTEDTEDTNSH